MTTRKLGLKPKAGAAKKPGLKPKSHGRMIGGRPVVYRGELPDAAFDSPTRDDCVLIHYSERPNDRHFPPVREGYVPPDTYYVFDVNESRIVSMVSVDAQGVYVAWDTTRDYRYFMRAAELECPRYIEVFYDQANAILAGETWNHGHRNWQGSLRVTKPKDDDRRPVTAVRRALPPVVEQPKRRKGLRPKNAEQHKRPSLRPKMQDGGILSSAGLDQGKLNSAAENVADKYADAFPTGGAKKLPLKRK